MRVIRACPLIVFLAASPALAQGPTAERPVVLTKLAQCRAIAAPEARLACFDREAAALDQAQGNGELVIMDRREIRAARKSLFGLSLPNLSILGDDKAGEKELSTIETTIRSATQNADGKWMLVLADGARWSQVDSRELPIEPRAGLAIKIRRGTMGAFLANIASQTAIRVRRVS